MRASCSPNKDVSRAQHFGRRNVAAGRKSQFAGTHKNAGKAEQVQGSGRHPHQRVWDVNNVCTGRATTVPPRRWHLKAHTRPRIRKKVDAGRDPSTGTLHRCIKFNFDLLIKGVAKKGKKRPATPWGLRGRMTRRGGLGRLQQGGCGSPR